MTDDTKQGLEDDVARKLADFRWAYWEMESKRLLEAWHDEPLTPTQLWCNGISPRSKAAKMSYRELVARGIIGRRK